MGVADTVYILRPSESVSYLYWYIDNGVLVAKGKEKSIVASSDVPSSPHREYVGGMSRVSNDNVFDTWDEAEKEKNSRNKTIDETLKQLVP